jgi:PAS domain S-box-containing protein
MGRDPILPEPQIPPALSGIAFGEILKSLDTPLIVFSATGGSLYANDAAARLLGFGTAREYLAADAFEAMAGLEYFDESLAPLPMDRLPSRMALTGRDEPARMVGYRRKPAGDLRWALVKATPIFSADGSLAMVVNILQDITGIKQAQFDLARTRDDQAAMLRIMETGCTAQDATGKLVYANAAAVRSLGFPDEASLLGSDPRAIFDRFQVLDAEGRPLPPERLPGRRALLGETVRGEILCYRVRATGAEHWSMVNATPLFDDSGQVRLAINIFADITEMRRAQAALEKHMRYLEGLNRVSGALQRTLDVEGALPVALSRLLEVFDCDRVWLIQASESDGRFRIPFSAELPREGALQPAPEALPEAANFGEVATACQATEDPLVFGREYPLPNADFWTKTMGVGSLKAISVRPQVGRLWILCLLRPPASEPWRGDDFAMFKDISLRIATALASMILYRDLRRSEEKYRTLFERSLDGIFRIAPDGAVLDANPAMLAMLGYTDRSELVGTRQALLLPAGGDASAHGDGGETFSVALSRRDGAPVWVEVNAQLIKRQSGEIAYYEGIVRNINDRKRSEEALKASEEKLRQAQKMEAVGRLAGGVAHDFNNLLTAINGFSDLLLMSVGKEDPRRSHLEEIRKAGARAAALTGQLLSFSRKQVLAPRVVDLNAVVKGMETMLRRLIGEDISLVAELEPHLKRVVADPNQMEQVILNLVLNARDAMPGGGELRIITANRSLREEERARAVLDAPAGEYALLSVRDTGTGMDDEVQARLFEPFFTTKAKDKGTGLGLSTVYGAVKQAGGALIVESAPGRGTDFSILLPEAAKGTGRPDLVKLRDIALRSAGGTETILLVEDEDAVRRLARDVLEAAGYTVHEAPGGEQALELADRLKDREIHLLLTDVVMGGISGRELSERLKAKRPATRVLFMSGYTEDAIIRHGVYTAQASFIGKPFSPASLTAKVREVLDAVAARPGTA